MKRNFTLTIPKPCHEKWDQFTPSEKGRFCGSCEKEVIDFTIWSEEQIKHYFSTRPTNTCGRFAPHQLTTYRYGTPSSKQPSLWAASLTFILLLVSRPSEAQTSRTDTRQEQVDKKSKGTPPKIDSVTQLIIKGIVTEKDTTEVLAGVNIVRKGTTDGTITDLNGKFELVIDQPKSNETLIISFVGFTTLEQPILADTSVKELKIEMGYDITQLGGAMVGGVVSYRWYTPRGLWWRLKSVFRR